MARAGVSNRLTARENEQNVSGASGLFRFHFIRGYHVFSWPHGSGF